MSNFGILHLCFDGNFINQCFDVFEKFYQNENIFLVNSPSGVLKVVKQRDRVIPFNISQGNYNKILKICADSNVNRVVIHGNSLIYIGLLHFFKEHNCNYTYYWIFWGYELYNALGQSRNYQLIDEKPNLFSYRTYIYPNKYNLFLRKILRKSIAESSLLSLLQYVNYFCFWNYADYELLNKYYNTGIKFKYFAYSAFFRNDNVTSSFSYKKKNEKTILINHQASKTGNHFFIMNRIKEIDVKNDYQKIVPLSYGSKYISKMVLPLGKRLFKEKFNPLLTYLNKDDYFSIIDNVEVAIFGARRQEASGNIHNLLKHGVKVFLRNDNNLLDYYRRRGYIIFSFDDEFNSLSDLLPLTEEQQRHNFNVAENTKIFYDDFMPNFFDK